MKNDPMKNMTIRAYKSQGGFSLLELMIAGSLGLIVILAMLTMFRAGINTTFAVTQRAETQQNLRAGLELMTKDISLAGGGLPSGGLQLPPAASKVACNQTGTCYLTGGVYPNGNFMYGILPGFGTGVQNGTAITSAPGVVNDSVTSVYCDYNFPLTNFTFSYPSNTQVNVSAPINPLVLPNNILAAGGLNVGDLMLFIVSTPGTGTGTQGTSSAQTAAAVAEITGLPSNTQINFAAGDALNFNQVGAANSLSTIAAGAVAGTTTTVCRLNVVTYFLQVPPAGGPGAPVQTPRLMRQVNGLNAIPVADNIINLQVTYDVINSITSGISANQANPIGAGLSPGLIQKVNLWVMGQGLVQTGNKAQSMYLASSVSTGNMSFCNSLSDLTTVCQ